MTSTFATFELIIDTGDAGMASPSQLGTALAAVAAGFKNTEPGFENDEGAVLDVNGNKVGRWTIEEASPPA